MRAPRPAQGFPGRSRAPRPLLASTGAGSSTPGGQAGLRGSEGPWEVQDWPGPAGRARPALPAAAGPRFRVPSP